MKKIASLIGTSALVALSTVIGGASVLAQTADPNVPSETPVTTQQQQREGRSAERCERITDRITSRIGRVNEATERQTVLYERLVDRLDGIIQSATAVEYDTAALVAARDDINERIESFVTTATNYTSDLAASADVACAETPATYGAAISGARESLREVRTAALAVRTAFREQAIPALQDFRAFIDTIDDEDAASNEQSPQTEEGVN